MINYFIKIKNARVIVVFHDFLVTALAITFAFLLRFDGAQLNYVASTSFRYLPYFIIYAGAIYAVFSLYSSKWRFASIQDLINILKACSVLAVSLIVVDYILVAQNFYGQLFLGKKVIAIYFVLQVLFLGGPRYLYRYYKLMLKSGREDKGLNLIVIGRSTDIELVARGVEANLLKGRIRGYVSPLNKDVGTMVRGIDYLGAPNQLETIINGFSLKGIVINQAIIVPEAFSQLDGGAEVLGVLRREGIITKSLKWNETDQTSSNTRFENIHDEEVLLRSLVTIDADPLNRLIKGKRVMVTGGGGSIGSEISKRVAMLGASEVMILESSEPALYHILEKLEHLEHASKITGLICDIRDKQRLAYLFEEHKPQLVFHAAALKHVPYLEEAPIEAIKTNTFGTINVANIARDFGTEAFVLISTDKATRPTSILGATKRLAELYVQMLDNQSTTQRFVSVRFGNVLATSGSVVPRFANQILQGGPVTVTHKDMVRYFMTVREATDLVLTSSFHALNDNLKQTAVYILNMGQPVKIYELAERMISMAGFTPNVDMMIKITGIRAGERLNEELTSPDEPIIDIGLNGVIATQKGKITPEFMTRVLDELYGLAKVQDDASVRSRLAAIVPGYRPIHYVNDVKAVSSTQNSAIENAFKKVI